MKAFETLKSKVEKDWNNITGARALSHQKLKELSSIEFFRETGPGDKHLNIQIVVYGSFARGELTAKSDIDWTLLVDGPADPEHSQIAQRIGSLLEENGFGRPSPDGAFGSMAGSHELIHLIGGRRDTNENMTRRMLLLLESLVLPDPSDKVILSRVIRQILRRYIDCDPSVSRMNSTQPKVPRFLLNDVVRYWRTMAVDYAAKKWEKEGKWALRNAKLRMSRKLIFVKGLLLCLKCQSLPKQDSVKETDAKIIEHCERIAGLSAIDVLSEHLLELDALDIAKELFGAYDGFLEILSNEEKRTHLETLRFDNAEKDGVFQEVRDFGKRFQAGLSKLFFDESNGLAELTKEYGVF